MVFGVLGTDLDRPVPPRCQAWWIGNAAHLPGEAGQYKTMFGGVLLPHLLPNCGAIRSTGVALTVFKLLCKYWL